ncbi:MAG: hypothetical protein HRT90_01240 [Candidatus Margulisbacteria bacterium]|nr:hypothetical protein [Candidatus Margulisiibacteriota bacterium]
MDKKNSRIMYREPDPKRETIEDVQKKINRVDMYLERANSRKMKLERQLKNAQNIEKEVDLVNQGKKLYDLESDMSMEV